MSDALEAADPGRGARHARRLVSLNPLDETAQTALIRTLLAADDRIGAFQAYESYRTLLREELEDWPGPKLRERMAELREELFAEPMGAAERRDAAEPMEAAGATGPDEEARPGRGRCSSPKTGRRACGPRDGIGTATPTRAWWRPDQVPG